MRAIITTKEVKDILNTYKITGSTKETAELLGVKISRVQYITKKYGILKNTIECQRKYEYNEHYFDCIDNEHKAYWLGFIYADGCVCYSDGSPRFSITLQESDSDLLEKFANDLHSNLPIRKYTKNTGRFKGHKIAVLSFRSRHFCNSLEKLGCVRHKSLVATFPKFLNPELLQHFIRGYFDGDGSVFISKEKHWRNKNIFNVIHFRFCGTYDMLSNIDNILQLKGRISNPHPNSSLLFYELAYKRNKKACTFYKYLYDNATIYLERKRNIFLQHFHFLEKDVQRL